MPTVLPGAYHSPYDRMIAELMMRKGDIQARRAEQQGAIWGRAAENLGQIGAQYVQQHQEEKVRKQRQQMFDEAISTWDGKDPMALFKRTAPIIGPEAAAQTTRAVAAFMQPHANEATFKDIIGGLYSAKKTLGEDYVAQHWPEYRAKLQQHSDAFNGGIQIEEQYRPEYGQMIDQFQAQMSPPREVKPLSLEDQLAAAKTPEEQQAILAKIKAKAEAGRAPDKTPAQIQAEAEARARGERIGNPGAGNAEPLVAIMGPDGQSVLVPRSQAVGKRPASGREQGRPVVSGDANRIADYDTSLNDLATLTTTLSGSHATGAAAKVGAALPNWVTEWTGVGADAKSKQAVIDRVKQVIGKALEGGVLRKEDEYKYEKILPTIGNPAPVVKAKLEGLEKAIRQRRETELNSLEDAGYDVSRYRQRGAPTADKKADPGGIR